MRRHRNQKQEEIFIQFMTAHPKLAKGFTKGDKVAVEQLWSQLGDELNGAGPPIKDVPTWKKAWIDWKAHVKKKLGHNKTEVRSTGGGQFNQFILTPADQEVANLCSLHTFVKGLENTRNWGVKKSKETAGTSSPPSPTPSRLSWPPSPSPNLILSPHPVLSPSENQIPSQPKKRNKSLNDLMEKENISLEQIGKEFATLNGTNQIVGDAIQNMYKKLERIEEHQKEILAVKKEKLEEFKKYRQDTKRHYKDIEKHKLEVRKHKAQKLELEIKTLQLEQDKFNARCSERS